MDFVAFWGIIAFAFILVVAGLIFLCYWIPKRRGDKKAGIILSSTLLGGLILLIAYGFFHDQFYTKSDVEKFLANQNIMLHDDFQIVKTDDDGFWGAYQMFVIEISQADKTRIIESIKNYYDFGARIPGRRESNTISKANYEDAGSYIRERVQNFAPGQSPVIERIVVHEDSNIVACYKYLP